jgi:S-formylglutathione hydrolase FrmB
MNLRTLCAAFVVAVTLPMTLPTVAQVKFEDYFLFDCNLDFYQAMRRARIPCQLRVRDGGHTWEYWHSALYIALPYVSRMFGK